MAMRTNENLVKDVLMSDYGPKSDGALPSLERFMRAANLIVNRVYTCSVAAGATLTTEELLEIETWLAAHMYVQSDQVFSSHSEAGASSSFQGQLGMGLDNSKYGQTALMLDTSGCLKKVTSAKRAAGYWLGTSAKDQTSWDTRHG